MIVWYRVSSVKAVHSFSEYTTLLDCLLRLSVVVTSIQNPAKYGSHHLLIEAHRLAVGLTVLQVEKDPTLKSRNFDIIRTWRYEQD